ncbi:MAG: efflux RND transporter periplasmic adaptor subunit [Acidobacteriota bacterium]|nr:efflux RND transporter periplasmic adaptor subunit [Acidobacteriota bacterium]
MEPELKSLQIDRSRKRADEPSSWTGRLIISCVLLFILLGAGRFIYGKLNAETAVDIVRVRSPRVSSANGEQSIILNATGYIIAAHKIEVAAKVIGKVSWIGVEKGDKVQKNQILVRLEDDEYRARLAEAKGQLDTLKARLAELVNGSRPEEIAKSGADVEQAQADLQNAQVTLNRTKQLVDQGVMSKQALDDAQARFNSQQARINSLQKGYELVKIGPRREQIDAVRAQIEQVKGTLAYAQTQLDNTVIRAPITGTVLERNVERGEFVTTGFVGDKGAKGYVVSLADLNDLQVELDINQNDFAKLSPTQAGVVTTDAYPDKKYKGVIHEISPEANRQKATVQVKVKVLNPDSYLRPEMNATVAFVSEAKATGSTPAKALITVPASAVKGNSVYIVVDGKALHRTVTVAGTTSQGVQIESGLIGGEDLISNPPPDLKDGQRVHPNTHA